MSRRGGAGGVPGSLTVGVEGAEDDGEDLEDLEDFFLFSFILDLFGWYSDLLLDSAAPAPGFQSAPPCSHRNTP